MQSGSLDQLNDFNGLADLGTFLRTADVGKADPNWPLMLSPATPAIDVVPENDKSAYFWIPIQSSSLKETFYEKNDNEMYLKISSALVVAQGEEGVLLEQA